MRFTFLTNPTDHDIPICNVKFPLITSDSVISTSTLSHLTSENRKPLWLSLSAYVREDGTLSKKNLFGIPSVTNEVFYVPETGEETPLFYQHQLTNPYYTHRRVANEAIDTPERLETGITLTSETGTTIVKDSLTVLTDTGGALTEYTTFYFDSSRLRVIASGSIPSCDRVIVRYTSIPIDLSTTSERLSVWRPEIISSSIPYLFFVTILSTSNKPMTVSFMSYDMTTGESQAVTEVTTPAPVFSLIPFERFTGQDASYSSQYPRDRVYTVTDTNEIVVRGLPTTYYIRSYDMSSDTKLNVQAPRGYSMEHDWFPSLSEARITVGSSTYGVGSISGYEYHNEESSGNNTNIIQIAQAIPVTYRRHNGYIGGIDVTVNNLEHASVLAFDRDANTIILDRVLTQQHHTTSAYISRAVPRVVDMTLNPVLPSHLGKCTARDNVIVILVPPAESGCTRPVVGVLPMYTDQGVLITYAYSTIFGIFNAGGATRNINRSAYIPLLPVELSEHPEAELLPLAAFYTINPLGVGDVSVEDARSAGGGRNTFTPFSFDYSRYDGEGTDLSRIIRVTVDQAFVNEYAVRVAAYDPDIAMTGDPEANAPTIARERLREVIRKFSLPGTELMIEEE